MAPKRKETNRKSERMEPRKSTRSSSVVARVSSGPTMSPVKPSTGDISTVASPSSTPIHPTAGSSKTKKSVFKARESQGASEEFSMSKSDSSPVSSKRSKSKGNTASPKIEVGFEKISSESPTEEVRTEEFNPPPPEKKRRIKHCAVKKKSVKKGKPPMPPMKKARTEAPPPSPTSHAHEQATQSKGDGISFPPSPDPDRFHNFQFRTSEIALAYPSTFRRRAVFAGRPLRMDDVHDFERHGFVDGFIFQDWMEFIKFRCDYYLEMVRLFFANMIINDKCTEIISYVNGREVKITPKVLADQLNIPVEGSDIS